MTDEELIARLNDQTRRPDDKTTDRLEAADRIEALIAERDEAMQLLQTLSNVNGDLSRDIYKTKLLLAKAVEALDYCINVPFSGWTIAQGYARAAIAEIDATPNPISEWPEETGNIMVGSLKGETE